MILSTIITWSLTLWDPASSHCLTTSAILSPNTRKFLPDYMNWVLEEYWSLELDPLVVYPQSLQWGAGTASVTLSFRELATCSMVNLSKCWMISTPNSALMSSSQQMLSGCTWTSFPTHEPMDLSPQRSHAVAKDLTMASAYVLLHPTYVPIEISLHFGMLSIRPNEPTGSLWDKSWLVPRSTWARWIWALSWPWMQGLKAIQSSKVWQVHSFISIYYLSLILSAFLYSKLFMLYACNF